VANRQKPTVPVTPEQLASEIDRERKGRPLALFLDYDGTLTPVVARPEMAVLSDDMRATIRKLAETCPVAVISGRKREDVEKLVALDMLYYAGSHGFDIAGPDSRAQHCEGQEFVPAVADAENQLRRSLAGIDGAIIEDKIFSVAVHYRLLDPADMPQVRAAVDAVLRDHPQLRETKGKRVIDLRPRVDWDKGKAVIWLLDAMASGDEDAFPVYIGDDVTDEDAFAALRDRGLSILVAEADQPSHADYRLPDIDAVKRFLDALLDARGL
jgi:alpha,alpha-trehalase